MSHVAFQQGWAVANLASVEKWVLSEQSPAWQCLDVFSGLLRTICTVLKERKIHALVLRAGDMSAGRSEMPVVSQKIEVCRILLKSHSM